jgi:hypothetical protein
MNIFCYDRIPEHILEVIKNEDSFSTIENSKIEWEERKWYSTGKIGRTDKGRYELIPRKSCFYHNEETINVYFHNNNTERKEFLGETCDLNVTIGTHFGGCWNRAIYLCKLHNKLFSKVKPIISKEQRKEIDRIWNHYQSKLREEGKI